MRHAFAGQCLPLAMRAEVAGPGHGLCFQRSDFTPRDCMEVQATVLIMSLMVQPRDRSLTGFTKPCIMGPMAMAPVDCCTACKATSPTSNQQANPASLDPAMGLRSSFCCIKRCSSAPIRKTHASAISVLEGPESRIITHHCGTCMTS